VILSYAQLAIEDLRPGDPLRDDMAEIERAAQRATELTRQLLAFSRRQVLQPRVIDLHQTIAPMERMLRRLIGEDIALAILAPTTLGHVLADPGQLEQVVMNLAVNARDAMPDGGNLTLELMDVHVDQDQADEAGVILAGDYVVLAMSDTGIGMDAATRAQIFEPFFTTKAPGKGTGLGLSTVFGIIRQSGGHIAVTSAPGAGSTFKLFLPRTAAPTEAATVVDVPDGARGSETILLVEDEDQVRVVTAAILRRNGYHVLDSSNGGEAFLISKSFPGKIDLLLTDVVMPRMNGRKLAEELAPQRPDMRVLYASGYTDDAIVQHGVLDAGIAFIQKPFTPTTLLRKLREVLGTGRTQRLPRLPGA
jgi:CheY-like chemotaxis protein